MTNDVLFYGSANLVETDQYNLDNFDRRFLKTLVISMLQFTVLIDYILLITEISIQQVSHTKINFGSFIHKTKFFSVLGSSVNAHGNVSAVDTTVSIFFSLSVICSTNSATNQNVADKIVSRSPIK